MPFLYMSRLPLELGTVSLIVLVSLSPAVQAETKTILSEAIYWMGDGETPSFAEAMVLQKAKQGALEEAGTYVESYTKVRNLDLNAEEIQTLAGGVVQVEVLEKKRSTMGDGFQFFIKIKATVTTDKVDEANGVCNKVHCSRGRFTSSLHNSFPNYSCYQLLA